MISYVRCGPDRCSRRTGRFAPFHLNTSHSLGPQSSASGGSLRQQDGFTPATIDPGEAEPEPAGLRKGKSLRDQQADPCAGRQNPAPQSAGRRRRDATRLIYRELRAQHDGKMTVEAGCVVRVGFRIEPYHDALALIATSNMSEEQCMLEQWEANRLLSMHKIFSHDSVVDISAGSSHDYQIEDRDGTESFHIDIWRSSRNARKVRYQMRYRGTIILARLCTAVPHTNPDGEEVSYPHMHRFRAGYDDKWAIGLTPFTDAAEALERFCSEINLVVPDIQGGLS